MASFLGINNEELEKAMEETIDCTGMTMMRDLKSSQDRNIQAKKVINMYDQTM